MTPRTPSLPVNSLAEPAPGAVAGREARAPMGGVLGIYYGVIILTLVYCFAFVDRQIFNMLVAPIKRDFGASDLEVGYLLGPAFILSYVALGLPAGWCADRFNRTRLLIFAGVAWGIGTMAAAFADSYQGLFFSRLFVGASEAFLYPAGMSLIADLYDRKRLPIATSIFIAAPSVGGGLALLGGGLLLNTTEQIASVSIPLLGTIRGWQLTLIFVGLAGLIPILLMATVPDIKRTKGATAKPSEATEAQYGLIDGTAYMLKRWSFYFTFFFGLACSSLVMLTITAWAPTFLARTFGLNPAEVGSRYGTLVLVFGLAGGIASPLINSVLKRWSNYPTMLTVRIGPYLLVLFASLLYFAKSETIALACLAGLTFSYIFPMSMASTSLQLACPPRLRGVAAAYYFVIVSLMGYGIGTTAVPLVASKILHDPNRIGESMAGISIFFGVLAIILSSIAARGFRAERDEMLRNQAIADVADA
ncbi:MAG: hypothetical protein JWN66_961 [Sphingomonas bacterium]|uniref:MFS transporter n=1 Tax=Sphingomonas bacterium TaxID=1895847 RepID=UPI00262746F0|nr:MFS transporter [Sphingomonas bacterium]MDB5703845.1 hypothetical protein [Sphingomonas bacterium]